LYGLRLREKQKAKRIYGLREEQFKRYVERARRKKGVTGEHLLELLERRLDNVVYRGGLASSRNQARQLINHGHFWINGSVVNIPSYEVREGDVIEFKESSLRKEGIKNLAKTATNVPSWLERDNSRLRVVDRPNIEEIKDLQISLIVEFYSR
jgi:small subunit ribosomal protein S4